MPAHPALRWLLICGLMGAYLTLLACVATTDYVSPPWPEAVSCEPGCQS